MMSYTEDARKTHGRREEILIMRKEVKAQTLAQRKRYDRLLRESQNTAIPPDLYLTKVSHFCWLPTPPYYLLETHHNLMNKPFTLDDVRQNIRTMREAR